MVQIGSFVLACLLLACCAATNVQQCNGKKYENLSENVQLQCKKSPCRLKKGTSQQITIAFSPTNEISDIKNKVSAEVFGVPLPFVGVDGNSICDKIFTEGGEKAECPVKAGTKYVYKDSFPILSIYPSIDVKVHWELLGGNESIICFEMPATIK